MFELPPILMGSEQQQLTALRDYLVRMARSLEQAENAPAAEAAARKAAAETAAAGRAENEEALQALRRRASALRALIVKTADTTEALAVDLGGLRHDMESYYLARSDFGNYMEQAAASFTATARGVVESYDFETLIEALSARSDALDLHMSALRGEIRRGVITDPQTGESALGIAIAENLRFTGAVHEENGLQYYELSPGQTLGLYTATGWQFWVNGSKRGWFDSRDGRLHVISEVAEDSLQLGADWSFSSVGGLGIKYIGG